MLSLTDKCPFTSDFPIILHIISEVILIQVEIRITGYTTKISITAGACKLKGLGHAILGNFDNFVNSEL